MTQRPTIKIALFTLAVLAIATTAGCKKKTTASESDTTSGSENAASAQRNVDMSPDTSTPSLEACALRTLYFGFDSAELNAEARQEIERAVECFKAQNSPVRLRLTGATDPRGTEEYNMALGEQRAQIVERYLTSLGVGKERLTVTSVGEEMSKGSDEKGWAEDRNVSAGGTE